MAGRLSRKEEVMKDKIIEILLSENGGVDDLANRIMKVITPSRCMACEKELADNEGIVYCGECAGY